MRPALHFPFAKEGIREYDFFAAIVNRPKSFLPAREVPITHLRVTVNLALMSEI